MRSCGGRCECRPRGAAVSLRVARLFRPPSCTQRHAVVLCTLIMRPSETLPYASAVENAAPSSGCTGTTLDNWLLNRISKSVASVGRHAFLIFDEGRERMVTQMYRRLRGRRAHGGHTDREDYRLPASRDSASDC